MRKNCDKKIYLLIGVCFLIIIGCFLWFFDKNSKNDDVNYLSYDNPLINDTYGLFLSDDSGDLIVSLTQPFVETITNNDLTSEEKKYIAYHHYMNELLDTENCDEYITMLEKEGFYCGNSLEEEHSKDTIVVDEKLLKYYVEKIFGDDSYESGTFMGSSSTNMYYYNDKYVLCSEGAGGHNPIFSNTFTKAYIKGDVLTIEAKVLVDNVDENYDEYRFIYTFEKNSDTDSYVFSSLKKEKVE